MSRNRNWAYSIIVNLFYRTHSIVKLFTYFRAFSNIFLNKLTALCQVYIIILIKVGLRNKRGMLLASASILATATKSSGKLSSSNPFEMRDCSKRTAVEVIFLNPCSVNSDVTYKKYLYYQGTWSTVAYFYGPIACMLLVNSVFFSLTLVSLFRVQKSIDSERTVQLWRSHSQGKRHLGLVKER